jgi:hypothetical protein
MTDFVTFDVFNQLIASHFRPVAGNTRGGSTIVPSTSCLTGSDWSVLQIKTTIVSCHTADSKRVKQGLHGTVILPLLVFPAGGLRPMFYNFLKA